MPGRARPARPIIADSRRQPHEKSIGRKSFLNSELSTIGSWCEDLLLERSAFDVGQEIHPEQVDEPEDQEPDTLFQPGPPGDSVQMPLQPGRRRSRGPGKARPGAGRAEWRFRFRRSPRSSSASGSSVSLGGVPASRPVTSSRVSHSGSVPSTDQCSGPRRPSPRARPGRTGRRSASGSRAGVAIWSG